LAGCLLALALSAGCIGTRPFFVVENKEGPPVCHVMTSWEPRVLYTPDPTHGGTPTPGLAGRLYLFGSMIGQPLVGDGSLVVDLYDDIPVDAGGKGKLIEKWALDKDTLKRLLRHDTIGDGYTLFLPWGTYRPDITKVHLKVSYQPSKGSPLFDSGSTIALNDNNAGPFTINNRVVMGQNLNPAQPPRPGTVPGIANPPAPVSQTSYWPPNAVAPAPATQAGYSPTPTAPALGTPGTPGIGPAPQASAPPRPYYTPRWTGPGAPGPNPSAPLPAQPTNLPGGMNLQQVSWPAAGQPQPQFQSPAPANPQLNLAAPAVLPPMQNPAPVANNQLPSWPAPGANVQPSNWPAPAAPVQPQPLAPAITGPPANWPPQGVGMPPQGPPPVMNGPQPAGPPQGAIAPAQNLPAGMNAMPVNGPAGPQGLPTGGNVPPGNWPR
jgi:hypothetical protein